MSPSLRQAGPQMGVGAVGGVGHHRRCHPPAREAVEHVQGQPPFLPVQNQGSGLAVAVCGPALGQETASASSRAASTISRTVARRWRSGVWAWRWRSLTSCQRPRQCVARSGRSRALGAPGGRSGGVLITRTNSRRVSWEGRRREPKRDRGHKGRLVVKAPRSEAMSFTESLVRRTRSRVPRRADVVGAPEAV